MRIIGHIPNPIMKITVFKMETRYSVKFEIGTMEQVYRIRQSDTIHDFESIRSLIDETFQQEVLSHFKTMSSNMKQTMERNITKAH